jgi:DNA topoisomerase IB
MPGRRRKPRLPEIVTDPVESAKAAGLRYVTESAAGIRRRRVGKSFTYLDAQGHRIRDADTVRRIRALAIPPAWTDVWICPTANGHTRRPAAMQRGASNTVYHARWRQTRDETKYNRMLAFAAALPSIRRRIGGRQTIDSTDVNEYLRTSAGEEFTEQDFRTWAGTVLAALALREVAAFETTAQARRNITRAIERVARQLGNTPTICRKGYVHPAVIDAYLDGVTVSAFKRRTERRIGEAIAALAPEEAPLLGLRQQRLTRQAQETKTAAA